MKKTIMLIALAIILSGCATSKKVRTYKKAIKGNWIVNAITYSKAGTYNVTLFEDVSKDCLVGSTWQFVPNNNTGEYTLSDSNCISGERYFIFSIQEIDKETGLYDLLLKPTNKKHQSETNAGFRLKLSGLSDNTMQWQLTETIDDKPFIISINFIKN